MLTTRNEALASLEAEVTRFLYREARLLDENRFHEWLDLLADDLSYEMPPLEMIQARRGESVLDTAWTTPRNADGFTFDLFADDKGSMVMRVERLDTGLAYAETPPSITQHLISNVEVTEVDEANNELTVHSKFVVYQLRPGRHESHQSTFYGSRVDRLRRVENGLRIVRRSVRLAHQVLPRTISIFF